MITFIWGGCVPLAGVQVYLCLQLSCKQDKGLGNALRGKREMATPPYCFTVSFPQAQMLSLFVIIYEHLNFPLLPFAQTVLFPLILHRCCFSFFGAGQIRLLS